MSRLSKILTAVGWLSIVLFIVIYGIELLPGHGLPVTLRWVQERFGQTALIFINILVALAFLALLPFRRSTKHVWKSHGVFVAFVIALMTEMFGWPLLIFLISPMISAPLSAEKYHALIGHGHARVGTAISLLGILLIALGWWKIHNAKGLVTTGIYRFIRHPQYAGIFLFTLGWILHYPTALTLILWPFLIGAYLWLSLYEEKQIADEFGETYLAYAKRTKRYIPFLI